MVGVQAYLKAGRTRKSVMLDDFCEGAGYCRRHAALRGEPHYLWASPSGERDTAASPPNEPCHHPPTPDRRAADVSPARTLSYPAHHLHPFSSTSQKRGTHVEEKNNSVVRTFVGYDRHASQGEVDLLNRLYQALHLMVNWFLPSQKLLHKERTGSHITKVEDTAQTLYARILSASPFSQCEGCTEGYF